MHQAIDSYDCCALAWQNPRSGGVCLPFSLVTFFWASKESDSPKAKTIKYNHLPKASNSVLSTFLIVKKPDHHSVTKMLKQQSKDSSCLGMIPPFVGTSVEG
jgi:hypothetical protein